MIYRWDFDTPEYSDYMSSREALPKAAFQYGKHAAVTSIFPSLSTYLISRVEDPHSFYADPDPAFSFSAAPDPGSSRNKLMYILYTLI